MLSCLKEMEEYKSYSNALMQQNLLVEDVFIGTLIHLNHDEKHAGRRE